MELKVRILRAFEPCSQPVACPRIPEGEGEGGGPQFTAGIAGSTLRDCVALWRGPIICISDAF